MEIKQIEKETVQILHRFSLMINSASDNQNPNSFSASSDDFRRNFETWQLGLAQQKVLELTEKGITRTEVYIWEERIGDPTHRERRVKTFTKNEFLELTAEKVGQIIKELEKKAALS